MKHLPSRKTFAPLALLLGAIAPCLAAPAAPPVDVDWPTFLARADLIWRRLPDRFESAAFTGNGHLGAMLFTKPNGGALKVQMGRSDVAFAASRIPIGDLVLRTSGSITGGDLRLDLWNAEVRGTLRTDRGSIDLRAYTHTDQMVNVVELVARGGETAEWTFEPGRAENPRKVYRKEPLTDSDRNAPPTRGSDGDVEIGFQPLRPAGGHATAWKVVASGSNRSTLYASVGYAPDETAAKREAADAVRKAAATGPEALAASHRAWWHAFWPQSFVSVPDTRLENFYQIQMYKMASATRPGRPALDLMGPWFRTTPWARIWWNLNIQLAYWPQLTGNRLALGDSLAELLDRCAPAFAANAAPFQADSAAVSRATAYDGVGAVGAEICNLPWAAPNDWLHYRYSMDDAMLRDRVFPLIRRSTQFYLHHLAEGPDGKLHLTRGHSPEYPDQPHPNPDCNIDLSLLRWGLQTLIASCERLKMDDPDLPRWRETLAKLTPYPADERGLRISASVPFEKSHRHYSHLLMIYPLYIMTPEQPENRDLVVRSLKHWMGMPKALAGYSFTGAASISALLGEGDEAARYLNRLLDTKTPPNTLYVEAGPCIETPLSAAASLNDMLLSSWGGRIRLFPGLPKSWKETAFHDLRTEGAFLVSALRRNGRTEWVRVKSLAGEPCIIRPSIEGTPKSSRPLKPLGDGFYQLSLAKGEDAVLHDARIQSLPSIRPVPAQPGRANAYGLAK
jgi:hypothetical protein